MKVFRTFCYCLVFSNLSIGLSCATEAIQNNKTQNSPQTEVSQDFKSHDQKSHIEMREELMQKSFQKSFQEADKDQDKKLSNDEFKVFHKKMKKEMKNNKKAIKKHLEEKEKEMEKNKPSAEEIFSSSDADKDGFITQEELKSFHQKKMEGHCNGSCHEHGKEHCKQNDDRMMKGKKNHDKN